MPRLLVLVGVVLLLAGCEGATAPRDWASRHGVDTGGGPPADRPATDPRNVTPHVESEPGREQVWLAAITGLVGVVGIAIAVGVWLLEARRRMRRVRDGLCATITQRLRREQFHDVAVAQGAVPLFRGAVTLGLTGTVGSERDRQRVFEIADDEVRRGHLPAELVADVSVIGARRTG